MHTLSGILEQTEAAIAFEWNFNRHDTEWKDKALNKHERHLSKIRSKLNLEGECADCRCIFQAPLNPTICEFCGSSDIRSTYFC